MMVAGPTLLMHGSSAFYSFRVVMPGLLFLALMFGAFVVGWASRSLRSRQERGTL